MEAVLYLLLILAPLVIGLAVAFQVVRGLVWWLRRSRRVPGAGPVRRSGPDRHP